MFAPLRSGCDALSTSIISDEWRTFVAKGVGVGPGGEMKEEAATLTGEGEAADNHRSCSFELDGRFEVWVEARKRRQEVLWRSRVFGH
jgi:hypothetical protein